MSDSYSELMGATLENYRRGRVKPIETAPEISGGELERLLGRELEKLVRSRLSLREQGSISSSMSIRAQSLTAAKSGKFCEAEQLLAKAQAPVEEGNLSPEGMLLHRAFQEPAAAYLDYRRGDVGRACSRICEAIATDAVLEAEYGYSILFVHRLHLVSIMVRAQGRGDRQKGAIGLACELLSYLQGRAAVLPFPVPWGSEPLARLPREVITVMFAKVTEEIAPLLAGASRQVAGELFAVVPRHLLVENDGSNHPCPRARRWLLVKEAFINNDVRAFCPKASQFLAGGRADTPLLWYALVIDFLALWEELALPDLRDLRQEIALDALSWEYFPQQFFSILDGKIDRC